MRKFRLITGGLAAALTVSILGPSAPATANEETPDRPAPAADHAPPRKSADARGQSAAHKPIKDEYIVTLKSGADPDGVARGLGVSPRFVYRSALNGFAARLNEAQVNALKRNPHVEDIEQDQEGGIEATQYTNWWTGQPWGLDRIDQRYRPLSGSYYYYTSGSGVRAYVIDTGLQDNHPEFGGRALNMYSAVGGSAADCNGHGTHVAGTIGGATYGVAKNALLRGVRVLDCAGSGSTSAAIAGVDWVRLNAIRPAVANMSLQYGYSSALNTAVYNLAQSGVFVAVAAGNWNQNACDISPASAYGAYTTGATDSADARSIWGGGQASNYGGCLDGNAPGTNIQSSHLNSGTATMSGTSMASPHVAGTAALYKSYFGDTYWVTIRDWINNNSTAGVITGLPSGTPNRLLYKSGL